MRPASTPVISSMWSGGVTRMPSFFSLARPSRASWRSTALPPPCTMTVGAPCAHRASASKAAACASGSVALYDAAYAIANEVAPDINDFGAIADATAKRIGMNESTFNDPAGLDDETSIGGGPMMSPFDMAIAVRNA